MGYFEAVLGHEEPELDHGALVQRLVFDDLEQFAFAPDALRRLRHLLQAVPAEASLLLLKALLRLLGWVSCTWESWWTCIEIKTGQHLWAGSSFWTGIYNDRFKRQVDEHLSQVWFRNYVVVWKVENVKNCPIKPFGAASCYFLSVHDKLFYSYRAFILLRRLWTALELLE